MPLLFWSLPSLAVTQVEIHVGQARFAGATVENLSATLDMDGRWRGRAVLKPSDLARLAQEHPMPVSISKGTVKGKAEFSGRDSMLERLQTDLAVSDVAFGDAEGLHAGEKIGGQIELDLRRERQRWLWSGKLDWNAGEAFWQPLYLANGVRLEAGGMLDDVAMAVDGGTLAIAGVGRANFSARLSRPDNRIAALDVAAQVQDFSGAYAMLLKPHLEKTLLGNLDTGGRADVSLRMREGRLAAFDVALHGLDVEDKGGSFALYGVNARIPWSLNSLTQAQLRYEGGRILKIPLGAADLAAVLDGYSLTAQELKLPVLDGMLTLNDVSAAFLQGQWHWHLGASLSPVSMTDFSHAVGWPAMQGKMAASIPMVTYSDGRMTADGAMGLDVFDGSVTVRNLALQNPLGLAPRLQADIQMRNFDLELLTRTYSFGAMTGRLDGDVQHLELSRWQPVKFDADFRSSPGKYPKKISQRAVENISALGGAGAAAAIQRSFLRFFKEFNYAKIGLSCKLRNGVCAMDGVEPAQSGYVIVKGSGIPAITVLGYNRSVSWGELLERIKRVTAGNASPVIK